MACTAWRDLADNVAETLTKGMRVIAQGRLKQENWEDKNGGGKRSRLTMEVDEIGPSLRYATAKVERVAKTDGLRPTAQRDQGSDQWSTGGTDRKSSFDEEPPW
jgi:single-strand DNA-binding protein